MISERMHCDSNTLEKFKMNQKQKNISFKDRI